MFGHDAATFDDYDDNQVPFAEQYGPTVPNGGYENSMGTYPGGPGTSAPDNYGNGSSYSSYPPRSDSQEARAAYIGSININNPPPLQQVVTVVFKDGRPAEQIHNYLLTSTTLTVLDQKYRDIPLDQVDILATQKTNRVDGIDFRVPGPSR